MKAKPIYAFLGLLTLVALAPAPGAAQETQRATTQPATAATEARPTVGAIALLVLDPGRPTGDPWTGTQQAATQQDVIGLVDTLGWNALVKMGAANKRSFRDPGRLGHSILPPDEAGEGPFITSASLRHPQEGPGIWIGVQTRASVSADQELRRFLAALAQEFESILSHGRDSREQYLRKQLEALRAQISDLTTQLDELLEAHPVARDLSPGVELNETLKQAMIKETREPENLNLKILTQRARRDAIAEQIAKLGAAAERAAAQDPVVVELDKVVKNREQKLQHVKVMAQDGRAPMQEVGDAEESLALARAELAKQRQAASQAAGGHLIADLNKELTVLTIDIVETQARQKALLDYAAVRQASMLRAELDRANRQAAESERELANVSPARVALEDVQITPDSP